MIRNPKPFASRDAATTQRFKLKVWISGFSSRRRVVA
jgi:hypothetical protein